MRILELTFKILIGCGCWLPDSWTSPYKRLIYHTHTVFVLLLIHTFTLSQIMDIVLIVDNADDFTDSVYMLLAMIVSCFKMFSLLINRSNIAMLADILMKKPCLALELEEIKIRQKYDKVIETNTLHYTILVELTCGFFSIASLFTNYRRDKLTFRAWLPFDYSSTTLFHVIYFHQLMGLIVGSVLHVAFDSLYCGLLLHICCQLEILTHRLKKVMENPRIIIRDCVIQHNLIYNFAIMLNKKFRLTITFQFIVSTLVICFILYQLTITNTGFIELGLYMSCMLTQIFLYCWYGNEVKLKSIQIVNEIFEMDWITLGQGEKKDLLTVMKRCKMPIEFTSGFVIPMNLDSFMGLLKTSYSVYNILQKM